MKNLIAKAGVLVAAGFMAFSAATPVQAATLMQVNVPFAFLAGDQINTAGVYWVRVSSAPQRVELRSAKSALAERLVMNGTTVRRIGSDLTKGFLRFERLGSMYVLWAVGSAGSEDALVVKPSKTEEQLAKATADADRSYISLTQ
jgi:hypothetical protein